MKFSKGLVFFVVLILGVGVRSSFGQNQWMDAILPPDHLLENFPWMDENGKVQSKGLFDFEDIRGIGQKDLLLIYRQSAPVNELDKPHNQTLNVCFYDPEKKRYEKSFLDEGGTIQWVRLLKNPSSRAPFLVLQRDDLKGGQVLKGFAYLDGAMKPILEASAPQAFVRFEGLEIWCSSKAFPKDRDGAEHVLAWDTGKGRFVESKAPEGGPGAWTGPSIAVAESAPTKVPVVAQAPTPIPSRPSHPSAKGWWDDPLDPAAAMAKLKTELVPDLVRKNNLAALGQKAKAFFGELQKMRRTPQEINGMRSSYYAAVASTLLDMGNKKDASYYLKTALNFQKDNPDALALRDKLR